MFFFLPKTYFNVTSSTEASITKKHADKVRIKGKRCLFKFHFYKREIESSPLVTLFSKRAYFIAFDKINSEFIGMCDIEADATNPKEMEVDIWVKHESQGRGYATEMLTALVAWVQTHTNLEYLVYSVTTGNARSQAIASKLGLSVLRTFEAQKRGQRRMVTDYKILLKNS